MGDSDVPSPVGRVGLDDTPRIMRIANRTTAVVLLALARSQVSAAAIIPESIVVTASPLPGSALDPDKLPVTVEVLSPQDIARFGAPDLLRALANAPGISFSDAQDNPFQPNVFYRGFEASPLAGDAQGLA